MTLLAAALLLLTACGADGRDEAAEDQGDTPGDPADELTPLRVGLVRFLPTFNIYLAKEEGFFEAHGLDVTLEFIDSQALVGQAVQAGDVDIGSQSYDGTFRGISQGFRQQVLYPHVLYSSNDPDADFMVRSDLSNNLQALADEPLAVNVGGQSWMAMQVFLEERHGLDRADLEFVDMAFADMTAGFDTGTIGGAHVVAPFPTAIAEAGVAETIGHHLDWVAYEPPYGDGTERFLVQASFAMTDWLEGNPETAQAYVAAMDAATRHLLDDMEAYTALVAEFTGLDIAILENGLYPEKYVISPELTENEVRAPIRFNAATGLLEEDLALDEVLSEYFPLAEE